MSKRSKEKKPTIGDWEVSQFGDPGETGPRVLIAQSWWRRTGRGWYTFTDEQGVAAEFAPGTVLSVRRVDPAETLRALGIGEDETRQSGYELTGGKP